MQECCLHLALPVFSHNCKGKLPSGPRKAAAAQCLASQVLTQSAGLIPAAVNTTDNRPETHAKPSATPRAGWFMLLASHRAASPPLTRDSAITIGDSRRAPAHTARQLTADLLHCTSQDLHAHVLPQVGGPPLTSRAEVQHSTVTAESSHRSVSNYTTAQENALSHDTDLIPVDHHHPAYPAPYSLGLEAEHHLGA